MSEIHEQSISEQIVNMTKDSISKEIENERLNHTIKQIKEIDRIAKVNDAYFRVKVRELLKSL